MRVECCAVCKVNDRLRRGTLLSGEHSRPLPRGRQVGTHPGAVDIAVVNARFEGDLGRLEGIGLREADVEEEEPILVG